MHRSRVLVPGLTLLLALTLSAQAPDPRAADHEELRALLRNGTQALNARQIDALAPLFARQFIITTVDGRTFRDLAGFKSYIDELYGTRVEKIEFHPEAAELTQFVGADTGLSWGKSDDTYTFKGGDVRTMTSHWTATVTREDGRWKVAALHMSANILDNPVIAEAKKYVWIAAAVAFLLGLILGFALRALTARRA